MNPENCEHQFIHTHCENCGGYCGMVCQECGEWYDGGDPQPVPSEQWCNCGNQHAVKDD